MKIAAAAIAVVIGYAIFVSTAGQRELRAARKAVRRATAWRAQGTLGTDNSHTEMLEVSCPDREHRTNRIVGNSSGNARLEAIDESIRIGNQSYTRMFVRDRGKIMATDSLRWTEAALNGPSICQQVAVGQVPPPLPDFSDLLKNFSLEDGGLDTVSGKQCHVWKLHKRAAKDDADDEQICLDDDHLPRHVKSAQSDYVFTDWNTHIDVFQPQ
jgi:hypothetical protein